MTRFASHIVQNEIYETVAEHFPGSSGINHRETQAVRVATPVVPETRAMSSNNRLEWDRVNRWRGFPAPQPSRWASEDQIWDPRP